jgi:hypothetical protein
MSRSNSRKAQEAVKKLRRLYQIGERSRRTRPGPGARGAAAIAAEAKELDVTLDTLYKARVFADPDSGYTRGELDQLCELCLQNHYPLGLVQVALLLSVRRKTERARLLDEVVRKRWTTRKLQEEIRKRYGTRRAGGRKPRVSTDAGGVYADLEGKCESWRRWYEEFKERDKTQQLLPAGSEVRRLLARVVRAVGDLQDAVTEELARLRPRRTPRREAGGGGA